MLSTAALTGLALAGCTFDPEALKDVQDTRDEKYAHLQGSILVVGSSALQPLAEAAAEAFMQKAPAVNISVQGGGSGQGLTQIAQGAVDVGNSDIFAEEKLKDPSMREGIVDNKVAVVGMALVAHKGVGVTNLTKSDVQKIFSGQVRSWSELGGADTDIVVIHRATGSGTRATFESNVMRGVSVPDSFTPQEQDSSGTVVKMMKETPGAISYVALSYVSEDMRALALDGVSASPDTIATGEYPIWSYEHMYTREAAKPQTSAYIDYMLSDEVQGTLVEQLGYIPITRMEVERTSDGTIHAIKRGTQ